MKRRHGALRRSFWLVSTWILVTGIVVPAVLPVANAREIGAESGVTTQSTELKPPDLAPSPIRTVDLRCAAGRTDLNHATAGQLRQALDISVPIAERVMASRPHYSVDDLLVVEGIGPGRLSKVDRSRFCSTPITIDGIVPAIPQTACSARQVDAAIAPKETLTAKTANGGLGLPEPVADRLLAHRATNPIPTLDHLAIVEGVGSGRLKQWVRDGVVCLTPAPFLALNPAGDLYKASLLSRARGEAVGLDGPVGGFSLGVPTGVLDQAHAWATVIDIPDAEHRGPRADFTIHGPWQGNGDQVFLTVPADSYQSTAGSPTIPAVVLDSDQPTAEFHLRSRVFSTGNSWTVASEHLTSAEASAQFGFMMFYMPTDKGGFGDAAEAWARENLTNLAAPAPTCAPDITAAPEVDVRTQPTNLMTDQSALGRPIFRRCVEGNVHAGHVNFTFANSSALAYRLPGDEGYPLVDMTDVTYKGDVLTQSLFAFQRGVAGPKPGYTNTEFVLPPAGTVVGSLGFPSSIDYGVAYDPINTSGYWAARTINAVLPPHVAIALAGTSCLFDLVRHNVGLKTIVDCAEAVGVEAAKSVSRLFLLLDSGHTLTDALDAAKAKIGFGSGAIDGSWHFHRHHPPVSHVPGSEFGGGQNDTGGPDGKITADGGTRIPHDVNGHGANSGTIYMTYDDSGVAYGMNLADPTHYATYHCLASRYPMRSYLPIEKLGAYGHQVESIHDASCDESVPIRVIPSNATNFILREKTGTAWFVDENSNLHWIRDGGAFICLAQRYYVLDHTPWDQINQFEDPVYAGDATCS